jgi:hypothetical protein
LDDAIGFAKSSNAGGKDMEMAKFPHITDIAAKWGARAAGPAEHKAATSDIPTLILAAEFDQNTPYIMGKISGRNVNQ